MKKILLALLLLNINYLVKSQEIPMHHLLVQLDFELVPTGFLQEYTLNWGQGFWYDASWQDTLPNDKYVWYQIHLDLERSVVNEQAVIGSYEDAKEIAEDYFNQYNIIPLMTLNMQYARIRVDALEVGLLDTIDGQLYDVEEREELPYVIHNLFIVSPFVNTTTDTIVKFKLLENLYI